MYERLVFLSKLVEMVKMTFLDFWVWKETFEIVILERVCGTNSALYSIKTEIETKKMKHHNYNDEMSWFGLWRYIYL